MHKDVPPENTEQESLLELVKLNQETLNENNKLLKKIHKQMVWGMWLRILWYGLLIGLPFALYYYLLEPYFETLGSSFETFSTGMQEIPGWKQFHNAINGDGSAGE